jgi:hypothetical protein
MIVRNIRLAVIKYRSWRAQKQLAKEATRAGKRKKHERLADQSKRDFLAACGRAAIIPGIALAGGIPLAYHLSTKKKEPTKTRPETKSNPELKKITLDILRKTLTGKTISSRYFAFLKIMVRLIKEDKIKIKLNKNPSDNASRGHIYDSSNNSLFLDTTIKLVNPLRFEATIIHELFHAYQDYRKEEAVRSISEAGAHLAENDFLLHRGYIFTPGWIKIDPHPKAKNHYLASFGIPKSIVVQTQNADFASPQYKKNLSLIAENYLWMNGFWRAYENYAYLSSQFFKYQSRIGEIEKIRQGYLQRMRNQPEKILENDPKHTVANYFAATKCIFDLLWEDGKRKKASELLNQSLLDFKQAFHPVKDKMFKEDTLISDGIA